MFTELKQKTFEQILEATSQQDAVMAYYYLDENNEVRSENLAQFPQMGEIGQTS